MASFIFTKQKGYGDQKQYAIRRSVTNYGLKKYPQKFTSELMEVKPLPPNTFPTGLDDKGPGNYEDDTY